MYRYIYNADDKKIGMYVVAVLLLIIFLFGLGLFPNKGKKGNERGMYTIGTIVGIREGRNVNDPIYTYTVKGISYESYEAKLVQGEFGFGSEQIGERYYVLFDSLHPSSSCLLPLNKVPDSIKASPPDGWSHFNTQH